MYLSGTSQDPINHQRLEVTRSKFDRARRRSLLRGSSSRKRLLHELALVKLADQASMRIVVAQEMKKRDGDDVIRGVVRYSEFDLQQRVKLLHQSIHQLALKQFPVLRAHSSAPVILQV